VGHRACPDAVASRKDLSPCQESNAGLPADSLVSILISGYTVSENT